jgi:murein hydrolase activator
MAIGLALALLAAGPERQLAHLDREVRRREQALAAAHAPLGRLLATVQRIARRPLLSRLGDGHSIGDLVRTRALLRGTAPAVAAATERERRALVGLQLARAAAAQAVAGEAERRDRLGGAEGVALNARLSSVPALPAVPLPGGRPVYLLPATGRVVVGTDERIGGVPSRGLTVATAPRTPVIAPAAGRVAYAGPFRGYGDIVILDHGGCWLSLIAGLGLATVAPHERVEQGGALGRMPPAAPRLTVELRHHNRPVDVVGMAGQRR